MNIALIAAGSLISRKEATWLTLTSLAKYYQQQGHQVWICAQAHRSLPRFERWDAIPILRIAPAGRLGKLLIGHTSASFLRQRGVKIDIIHGFSSSPALAINTLLARRIFPQAKTIHTIKSLAVDQQARFLFTSWLSKVDLITVPTFILKRKLVNFGCPEEKIKIIHSNIDVQKYKPRSASLLRRKYGYKKKVILYYGALRPEKGVDTLMAAIPWVLQLQDVHFLFAIRSQVEQKRQRYLQRAAKLGIVENITITLDDLPIEEYVSMADAVVLAYPTLTGTEGNPSCVLESMAAGTPVITTNLPELQEIVSDKEVIMVKPKDPVALAMAINKVLTDRALREKLSRNGRKKALEFSTEKIGKEFLEVYSG